MTQKTPLRTRVITFLEKKGPAHPKAIAKAIKANTGSIYDCLSNMTKEGALVRSNPHSPNVSYALNGTIAKVNGHSRVTKTKTITKTNGHDRVAKAATHQEDLENNKLGSIVREFARTCDEMVEVSQKLVLARAKRDALMHLIEDVASEYDNA
jgi:DNA-binding PadR family transcriptional regulator